MPIKHRKWHFASSILLLPALALAGCAAPAGGSGGSEDVTLRVATFTPEGSIQGQAIDAFANSVEELSGGSIQADTYYNASLFSAVDTLSSVGAGVADVAAMTPMYYASELPINNWMLQLGSLPSQSFPGGILSTSGAAQEFQNEQEVLQQEWEAQNTKLLWSAHPGTSWLLQCTKPIETLEDASGLRVRVGSSPWTEEMTALGMVPVEMAINEVYEGLQRGAIDCVILSPTVISGLGLLEVAKHVFPIASSSGLAVDGFIINQDTWSKLSEEQQSIVREATAVSWETFVSGALDQYDEFFEEEAVEADAIFHDTTLLDEVLIEHQKEYVAAQIETPPTGLSDADGFVQSFQESLAEWESYTTETLGVTPPGNPVPLQEEVATAPELDLTDFFGPARDELFIHRGEDTAQDEG